jgi:hypothetical protein
MRSVTNGQYRTIRKTYRLYPLETEDGHATYKGETLNPGPGNRDISGMIGGSQGSGAMVSIPS